MNSHPYPRRAGWLLDNPFRRLWHKPKRLLSRYVSAGMIVFDLGAGTGFFTRRLARLVGPNGKVIAVDLQQSLLDRLVAKVHQSGLAGRVVAVLAHGDDLELAGAADFILAFWMLHEVQEPRRVLEQVYDHLKPGGKFLLIEPRGEVCGAFFREFLEMGRSLGLRELKPPHVALSRAALFEKAGK
jgi:ubiquinone/menaquinone biosynthesis C-methylase UbiE